MSDPMEQASTAHQADVELLAALDDDQIHFLGNLYSVEDPLSDGLECDHLQSDETSADEVTNGST
jgi:hypothetical protein